MIVSYVSYIALMHMQILLQSVFPLLEPRYRQCYITLSVATVKQDTSIYVKYPRRHFALKFLHKSMHVEECQRLCQSQLQEHVVITRTSHKTNNRDDIIDSYIKHQSDTCRSKEKHINIIALMNPFTTAEGFQMVFR